MSREAVNKRIKALGLKKSHVADKIGITNVMLSYYLNNKKDLSSNKEHELKRYLSL
jgi:predicted transcriptional regulator